MMPRSVSQTEKKNSSRPGYRPIPYGGGTVRFRNGKWEARWTEAGSRRGKNFLIREEAEDFLLAIYRARGRELPEERYETYDGNVVYFMQSVDGGLIKIGHARDPLRRLRDLQTGSPVVLQLLGITDGGLRKEVELHERFSKYHVRDEWFQPSPELRRWIICNAVGVNEEWAMKNRT